MSGPTLCLSNTCQKLVTLRNSNALWTLGDTNKWHMHRHGPAVPPPPRVHRNARSHLSGSKLEEKSENMFLWSFSETLKSKNRCIEQFRRTLWNIPAFLISFFPTHWTRLLFPIMFPLLRKHGSFHSLKEFLLLNGCHLNLCFITLTGSCP